MLNALRGTNAADGAIAPAITYLRTALVQLEKRRRRDNRGERLAVEGLAFEFTAYVAAVS